ncbi:MAG: Gfo/Idh/MocA family oxidoreductase [Victivallaceae bacterium]
MKQIKTCVIGLGRIAWSFHIPELLKHKFFDLIAVVDPIAERRDDTKHKFGIGKAYKSAEEMYSRERPDLVVVASPTCFHKNQIIQAFEMGCDVFSDKPIAMDLQEADQIIAAMKKHHRKLMVYQPRRLDSDCHGATEIIGSGKLGQIYMIQRGISAYTRRNDWQAQKKYGGGMLNNYGVHFLDQLLYLLGDSISEVFCKVAQKASVGDAEDVVKAVLTTQNGIILDLDINQACAYASNRWLLIGTNGSAFFNQDTGNWSLKYFRPGNMKNPGLQHELAAENRMYNTEKIPWIEETWSPKAYDPVNFWDLCYDYYGKGMAPFVEMKQVREVIRVIDECKKSS